MNEFRCFRPKTKQFLLNLDTILAVLAVLQPGYVTAKQWYVWVQKYAAYPVVQQGAYKVQHCTTPHRLEK